MRKILFDIPALGIKVPSFGVLFLLACVASLYLTAWRARREKLNPETVFELAIWLMGGGFIGARVLYIVAHPESVTGLLGFFKIWQGGIVFYGCIIGGLIGSLIYWARNPFPFRPMADAVAPLSCSEMRDRASRLPAQRLLLRGGFGMFPGRFASRPELSRGRVMSSKGSS